MSEQGPSEQENGQARRKPGQKVWQFIGMSHGIPATGYFRYKNAFLLLPAPECAPRPPISSGEFPFVLQVHEGSLARTGAEQPEFDRLAEALGTAKFVVQLLNVLLRNRVTLVWAQGPPGWVSEPIDDGSEFTSRYIMRGYSFPGWRPVVESFAETERLPPIESEEVGEYYLPRPGAPSEVLKIPMGLDRMVDRVCLLEASELETLRTAMSWYESAQEIFLISSSSALVAYVTAIESLMGQPEKCPACHQTLADSFETCDQCGQPKYRVMKRFKAFLESVIISYRGLPDCSRAKKELYTTRSKLAHGLGVMAREQHPFGGGQDIEINYQARTLAIAAIRHWLAQRIEELRGLHQSLSEPPPAGSPDGPQP